VANPAGVEAAHASRSRRGGNAFRCEFRSSRRRLDPTSSLWPGAPSAGPARNTPPARRIGDRRSNHASLATGHGQWSLVAFIRDWIFGQSGASLGIGAWDLYANYRKFFGPGFNSRKTADHNLALFSFIRENL